MNDELWKTEKLWLADQITVFERIQLVFSFRVNERQLNLEGSFSFFSLLLSIHLAFSENKTT
jgi:hypothetical protein